MSGRRLSPSRGALVLGAAALLLAGCASLPPARPPIAPEVQRLLDLLHQQQEQFDDLRALADITIRHAERVQRLTGVLLLQAPASLRFEALTPWGQPFLLMAGNGETFTLYRVDRNQALVGPASAQATQQWLGFAIEPGELVSLLAGHVRPLPDAHAAEWVPADGAGPSIQLTGGDGVQRIWLDPDTGVVRQVELPGGKARIAYSAGGPGEPPAALTLTAADLQLTITVRYREARLGTGIPPALFTLNLPDRVKIQHFR